MNGLARVVFICGFAFASPSRPRLRCRRSARVDPSSAILKSLARRRASGVRGAPRSSTCSIPRHGCCRGGCTRSGIQALRAISVSSGRLIALRRTSQAGSTAPASWCGTSRASRPTTSRRSSQPIAAPSATGGSMGAAPTGTLPVCSTRVNGGTGWCRAPALSSFQAAMNMSASSGPARPTAPVAMSM